MILAGVKSVVLHDATPVELRDLSAQFYLAADDVGTPTSDACQARLQELNVAVSVTSQTSEITMDQLTQFQVRSLRLWGLSERAALRQCACPGSSSRPEGARVKWACLVGVLGPQAQLTTLLQQPPISNNMVLCKVLCPSVEACPAVCLAG